MLSRVAAVDEKVGYAVGTFKTKVEPLAFPVGRNEKAAFVVAETAFIVCSAREGILCVPRVRQIDAGYRAFFHLVAEAKLPVVV